MIITGSRADSAGVERGEAARDWDFLCRREEFELLRTYLSRITSKEDHVHEDVVRLFAGREVLEIEIALPGSAAMELLDQEDTWPLQVNLPLFLQNCNIRCPPRQLLAQIKRAHTRYEYGFAKTIRDYHAMRDYSLPWDGEWVERRRKEVAKIRAATKKISLKKSADHFFDQSAHNIKPLFVHDAVHIAIAPDNIPAYTLFQTEEVFCSRDMFEQLPLYDRVRAVVEESQVLAIERVLAPAFLQGNWFGLPLDRVNPQMAFEHGLMRVCTTITSGWFREFATEHWPQAMAQCDPNYWANFLSIKDTVPLYMNGLYVSPERVNLREK